ncbi:MAG: hypothetical protein ACI867_002304 [Glaciecola sp.]|jgi:hypothetical protein
MLRGTQLKQLTEGRTVRVEVVVKSQADRAQVWRTLVNWERQSEWMLDAKSVEVVSENREGVGVTIVCPTNLLGFTVRDVMRVTRWVQDEVLEVIHLGKIITGVGAFELQDTPAEAGGAPAGTTIRWWEEVDPPGGAVGSWGADTFVAPIVRRIFTRSLTNLARLAEQDSAA